MQGVIPKSGGFLDRSAVFEVARAPLGDGGRGDVLEILQEHCGEKRAVRPHVVRDVPSSAQAADDPALGLLDQEAGGGKRSDRRASQLEGEKLGLRGSLWGIEQRDVERRLP